MKAYAIVIKALLMCGSAIGAQAQTVAATDGCRDYLSTSGSYRSAYVERAVKNYRDCLESPNPGVVESALAHVAKMKLVLPKVSCRELEKRIDFLTIHGESPSIRYKAYLTRMLFDNPGMFAQESLLEYKESEELFAALASKIQQTLLGYGGQ